MEPARLKTEIWFDHWISIAFPLASSLEQTFKNRSHSSILEQILKADSRGAVNTASPPKTAEAPPPRRNRAPWIDHEPPLLPISLLFSFSPVQSTWEAQYSQQLSTIIVFLASSSLHPSFPYFCGWQGAEGFHQVPSSRLLLLMCLLRRQGWAASVPRAPPGALHHCKLHNCSQQQWEAL